MSNRVKLVNKVKKKIRPWWRQVNKLPDFFSESYYLSQFPESERVHIKNPLEHFLLFWNQNGYDPNPFFSMSEYLVANPDVADHLVNPLVHYIDKGISENRPLRASKQLGQVSLDDDFKILVKSAARNLAEYSTSLDLARYLVSIGCEFTFEPDQVDPSYYQSYFRGELIIDYQEHFDQTGWKLGLNPTAWFNTQFYLDTYPDVANSGLNPFIHFVNEGYREARIPSHRSHRTFKSVLLGESVESEARDWSESVRTIKITDHRAIERDLRRKMFKQAPLVVSIGHSAYLSDVGGIQLYTFIEAEKFNKLGINYLHIAPSRTLPTLADRSQKDLLLKITFNNNDISGELFLSDLFDLISSISANKPTTALIVNSIYGWHPELLKTVIDDISPEKSFWFFHDYSMFCSNPTLNFENVSSCHNPKINSGICSTCRFGQKRDEHVSRIRGLIASRDWEFVSPSASASANIVNYLDLEPSRVKTISHGQIKVGSKTRSFSDKPRVAFIGHPVVKKGWLSYLNFVDMGLKEFDFYHFGSVDTGTPGIKYLPLFNQFDNLNVARDLLIENQIDAVFICPTWEETFCFVAYEAQSAGCMIITSRASGNVVDAAADKLIEFDDDDAHLVFRIRDELLEAREVDRFISDFVFNGTIASMYAE
jgi:glycosyltransferase involved in cell wall biosynthesis